MKNKSLVLAQIEKCRAGNNDGDNCKKLMMEWIVKNHNSSFKIADLADELGAHVPTASKALYNLQLDGFVFSKKRIGPNWFIYRYLKFVPVVKEPKKKRVKIRNSDYSDSWTKALALMV